MPWNPEPWEVGLGSVLGKEHSWWCRGNAMDSIPCLNVEPSQNWWVFGFVEPNALRMLGKHSTPLLWGLYPQPQVQEQWFLKGDTLIFKQRGKKITKWPWTTVYLSSCCEVLSHRFRMTFIVLAEKEGRLLRTALHLGMFTEKSTGHWACWFSGRLRHSW